MRCSIIALIAVGSAACGDNPNRFEDPICGPDEEFTLPIATLVHVGIFDPAGQPRCIEGLRVRATQGDRGWGDARPLAGIGGRVEMVEASREEHLRMVIDPDGCNLYLVYGNVSFVPCSDDPLEYVVEAPGCEPVHGSMTWDENWYPGLGDRSFHVIVKLSCPP